MYLHFPMVYKYSTFYYGDVVCYVSSRLSEYQRATLLAILEFQNWAINTNITWNPHDAVYLLVDAGVAAGATFNLPHFG
jgi:hypothetical protein